MRVIVKLFALAKQKAGCDELALDVPEPATVADLRRALAETCLALAPMVPHLMIAVDAEYAGDNVRVRANSEVAAIPPVSGGLPASV